MGRDLFGRAFLVAALVVAAPALAQKTAAPQPIARIDSLIATQKQGWILIQAKGAVAGGGWKTPRLRPAKPGPGDARAVVVEFVAVPPAPDRAVIDGLLPVAANAQIRLRKGIVSVRAVSGSNEITTQILK